MRDLLLLTAAGVPTLFATVSQDNLNFWERILEKWGIGFIGLGLFLLLAWRTEKKAEKEQLARDARDQQDVAERKALAERNNQLQEQQLAIQTEHARRLEQLVKDGNKSVDDHASALRMLIRKMKRPCVGPIEEEEK